ncbi:ABC transporter permease subunit [Paraclostridium bifermentans]|nr:ABC transporter permease subunit [Paraclostridium bifermentans]
MNIWKGVGYGSIVYLKAIVGIDRTYYEAATIDGASKWQQIKNITIPLIVPLMIILTIMAIGRIFNSDFGLFYNILRNSAVLYPVTDVIDTYIYKGLMNMGNIEYGVQQLVYIKKQLDLY